MSFVLAHQLKSAHVALTADEVLRAPIDVLLGVPAAARDALAALGIRTVFDLAASELFATADTLLRAETDPTLAESRLNAAARDAVAAPPGVPVAEWSRHPLTLLAGFTDDDADALSEVLDVATIRDLALWPPFVTARTILQRTFGGTVRVPDPEAPDDLLPKPGTYATERVFYEKLVIDLAPQPNQGTTALEDTTGVDLDAALAAPIAFQRVATGALLTFRQSWFSLGVTLGQLLHSLALAPGESTRIAVVDWERRTRGSSSEAIDEREQLANDQSHTRALNEVTSATATETQEGNSKTSVDSTTTQKGGGAGLELGPFALGGSYGKSTSHTKSMSTSSSSGARDLSASLSQQINDRTQQHASSARSRRASAVREVSQTEHESISTRVVTNYNHMHALTVQYFETVQAYRVTTELARAERCLFVPIGLLDFTSVPLLDRLRTTLAESALTATAYRQLTSGYGNVEVIPQTPRVSPGAVVNLVIRDNVIGPTTGVGGGGSMAGGAGVGAGTFAGGAGPAMARDMRAAGDDAVAPAVVDAPGARGMATLAAVRFDMGPPNTAAAVAAVKGWNLAQLNLLGSLTGRTLLRQGSDSVFLPREARLLGVVVRDGQLTQIQLRSRTNTDLPADGTTPTSVVLASPVPVELLQTISVQNAQDRDVNTTLGLNLAVAGSVVTIDVPIRFRSKASSARLQEVIRFGAPGPAPELVQHLEANRLHYSRAVFERLDEATVAAILARFTYKSLPLGRVVNPRPIATTANFLVFKVNVPVRGDVDESVFGEEQREFREFLQSRGLDSPAPQSQIVPLPSAGVFAEAVLGRFNSAETLDITRFFNWQDSPIPIEPPDIAPITASSRAEADALRPGQLGASLLSIQKPTALPAAAGVGPMLQALQAANLFRDMSGMDQTAALAQSAVKVSGAGATSAGDIAAQNLKTTMEQNTARMKIAAEMLGSIYQAQAGTLSAKGAQLNEASKVDEEKKKASTQAPTPGTLPAPGAPSAGGSTGSPSAPAGTASAPAPQAAPPSLATDVLEQQSGAGLATAAEQLADAATTPQPVPAAPATQPRGTAGTSGSSGSSGGSTPATSGVTPTLPVPQGPVEYHLLVHFQRTGDAVVDGLTTVMVADDEVGGTIGMKLGVGPPFLIVPFKTSKREVVVTILSNTLKGAELTVRKTVALPQIPLPVAVAAMPVVRERTFMVGAVNPAEPNLVDLDIKVLAAGIAPTHRVGDPTFEVVAGVGFKATVRHLTGELALTTAF